MSKTSQWLAVVAAMAAMSGGKNIYDGPPSMSGATRRMLDDHQKERNHRMNPVDLSEREFVIHGEAIMAHDRKTAMKIYANRHPETRKKHKKRK